MRPAVDWFDEVLDVVVDVPEFVAADVAGDVTELPVEVVAA